MQVLKLKKKTSNKIDMIRTVLRLYCYLSEIKITNTELMVMSYFINYGVKKSTKKLILSSEILRSINSLENTVTKLRKLGFLIKDTIEETTIVRPDLNFLLENKMLITVQLDNL